MSPSWQQDSFSRLFQKPSSTDGAAGWRVPVTDSEDAGAVTARGKSAGAGGRKSSGPDKILPSGAARLASCRARLSLGSGSASGGAGSAAITRMGKMAGSISSKVQRFIGWSCSFALSGRGIGSALGSSHHRRHWPGWAMTEVLPVPC